MAKGKLFNYAVIYHPPKSKSDFELGVDPKSELVSGPTSVLAADEVQARVYASRAIPPDYADKIDNLEIVVRPF